MKRQQKRISVILMMAFLVQILSLSGMLFASNHVCAEQTGADAEVPNAPANLTSPLQTDTDETASEIITGNEDGSLLGDLKQELPETDRYIVKYRSKKGRQDFIGTMKDRLVKVRNIKSKKGSFDLIILNESIKPHMIKSQFEKEILDKDIEYIQPDYKISLSSNDAYFESQWGLENKQIEAIQEEDVPMDDNIRIIERLHMLPPHLREIIESNPELMELIMETPPEELRDRLMMGDVPGDIPLEILLELAHDPALMEIGDSMPMQQAYACDAGVTEAWEKSLGEGVTVAVIDTGIDIYHEDLAENIWVNTGKIPGNGIDDDDNGYVDDIYGWNFCDDNNVIYSGMSVTDEVYGGESVTEEVYGSGGAAVPLMIDTAPI